MTKVYFAGVNSIPDFDILYDEGARDFLLTFFDHKPKVIEYAIKSKVNILIDPGSFIAYKKGKSIDLDKYCEFLEYYMFENYMNLDVIGDSDLTLKNYRYIMKVSFFKPKPIFHYGTNFNHLKEYFKSSYHIFLGGIALTQLRYLHIWLNDIKKISPEGVKYHGLGVGNKFLLKLFDFYSVDTSNWILARWGRFLNTDWVEQSKNNFKIELTRDEMIRISARSLLNHSHIKKPKKTKQIDMFGGD